MGTIKRIYSITYINDKGFPVELRENAYSIVEFMASTYSALGNKIVKALGVPEDIAFTDLASPVDWVLSSSTIPGVPTTLTVDPTSTTVLTFTHDLMPGALFYEYDVDGGDGVQYAPAAVPKAITGLTTDTQYTIRVRAGNAMGMSAWCTGVQESTPAL